ncbi:hypothetical protein [Mycobacterium intracellulare]|uniref:hypothetical protein n=1 Tax=Mycobacterium intracellulare TaxID=1767 RepID=UPI000449A775|nr:hypothetical protein [Mycobacterium intracellulare]ETZ33166.1 hypothetical protein L843_3652 [Mycobacterium intracellulare MIN_061107_1834]MCA2273605.1 hypothetical protein [Mycobacterium intracellulare]MCA2325728.1 hypothetical protein [Mycobacterium intracellulare]UEB26559.1 hypothetical protein LK403_10470 [Mycobacterium intracellulare]WVL05527.1 hypothetical protein KN247_25945 [Mycobacterium intracellulare]
MRWGDVPGWVALVISLCSALLSWRVLRWEKQSAKAADRSADEAARANLIAERALEAGIAGRTTASDETKPAEVAWRIEKGAGDQYVLRNTGTDTAEHVYVDESRAPRINRRLPHDSVVQPGAGHTMLLKGSMQSPMPNELYLKWAGQDDWVAVPLR